MQNIPKYKNVDEYSRARSSNIDPLDETTTKKMLDDQEKNWREKMLQKEYESKKKSMEYESKNQSVLSHFMQIKN
jgi:hypothetical protein